MGIPSRPAYVYGILRLCGGHPPSVATLLTPFLLSKVILSRRRNQRGSGQKFILVILIYSARPEG